MNAPCGAGTSKPGFPRLYAAASLKLPRRRARRAAVQRFSAALCRGLIEAASRAIGETAIAAFSAALCRGLIEATHSALPDFARPPGFPRLYAAASLKHDFASVDGLGTAEFSAALCRGLIEADERRAQPSQPRARFPRLYAAASLKRVAPTPRARSLPTFSAALCRGLIEALGGRVFPVKTLQVFSAALCRGLIEARAVSRAVARLGWRFPRLYAAASLKHGARGRVLVVRVEFSAALCRGLIEAGGHVGVRLSRDPFSAALCRGLIEARSWWSCWPSTLRGFPRLYAAASLKPGPGAAREKTMKEFSAALCRGLIEARCQPRQARP